MKSSTMLSALKNSRQFSQIASERVTDYLNLFRVEMKIRGTEMGLKVAGYAAAGLFAFLATLFLGFAIIVSFWETDYRILAAWGVVVLFALVAFLGYRFAAKQTEAQSLSTVLRSELQQDINTIKESL